MGGRLAEAARRGCWAEGRWSATSFLPSPVLSLSLTSSLPSPLSFSLPLSPNTDLHPSQQTRTRPTPILAHFHSLSPVLLPRRGFITSRKPARDDDGAFGRFGRSRLNYGGGVALRAYPEASSPAEGLREAIPLASSPCRCCVQLALCPLPLFLFFLFFFAFFFLYFFLFFFTFLFLFVLFFNFSTSSFFSFWFSFSYFFLVSTPLFFSSFHLCHFDFFTFSFHFSFSLFKSFPFVILFWRDGCYFKNLILF